MTLKSTVALSLCRYSRRRRSSSADRAFDPSSLSLSFFPDTAETRACLSVSESDDDEDRSARRRFRRFSSFLRSFFFSISSSCRLSGCSTFSNPSPSSPSFADGRKRSSSSSSSSRTRWSRKPRPGPRLSSGWPPSPAPARCARQERWRLGLCPRARRPGGRLRSRSSGSSHRQPPRVSSHAQAPWRSPRSRAPDPSPTPLWRPWWRE